MGFGMPGRAAALIVAASVSEVSAMPMEFVWKAPVTAAIEDPWLMERAVTAPRTGPILVAAEPRDTGLDALVFPHPGQGAPFAPSAAHDAVDASRADAGPRPADPRPSPFVRVEAAPPASLFGALMAHAPAEIAEAARFGLRDALGAGLAARSATLRPREVAEALPAPSFDPGAAARNGGAVLVLSGVIGASAVGMAGLYATRRRPPPKLSSRRFG